MLKGQVTQARVDAALNAALLNGAELFEAEPERISYYLWTFDEEFAGVDAAVTLPLVQDWMRRQRN